MSLDALLARTLGRPIPVDKTEVMLVNTAFAGEIRDKPDHGPAVENGVIHYLSVSALQSGDPQTYAGCQRRYFYKYVLKKKEPERGAQRVGKLGHAEAEHYLKTGENVLGPMMSAGKKFMPAPSIVNGTPYEKGPLQVEQPFAPKESTLFAIQRRVEWIRAGRPRYASEVTADVVRLAGLAAGGIPLVGFIDVAHARGEYVDEEGLTRDERPEHGLVVENIDHKTSSQIGEKKIKGRVYPGFAKTAQELFTALQMIGYGKRRLNEDPRVDHVRSSHIYYQTRGAREAKKVTALMSAEHIEREWERVDALALELSDITHETDPERVPANPEACNTYKDGCPHRSYCAGSKEHIPTVNLLGKGKGVKMSIFNKLRKAPVDGSVNGAANGVNGGPPPAVAAASAPVPANDEKRVAEIAAEKARLRAEDDAKVAPKTLQGDKISVTVCVIDKHYLVDCDDGEKPSKMKFTGSSRGKTGMFYFFVDNNGGQVRLDPPDHVWEVVSGAESIIPPDAPPPDVMRAAAPITPAAIQEIQEASARAIVAGRNAEVQKTAEADRAATGGRCAGVSATQPFELTTDEAIKKKTHCKLCGKKIKLKTSKEGDKWMGVAERGHNIPVQTVVAAQPALAPSSDGALPGQTALPLPVAEKTPVPVTATAVTSRGVVIYLDCTFERGPQPAHLDEYVRGLMKSIADEYKVSDIRFVTDKSCDLAYGNWKAALAIMAEAHPPTAGEYQARSADDVAQIVVGALALKCERVVRGGR